MQPTASNCSCCAFRMHCLPDGGELFSVLRMVVWIQMDLPGVYHTGGGVR